MAVSAFKTSWVVTSVVILLLERLSGFKLHCRARSVVLSNTGPTPDLLRLLDQVRDGVQQVVLGQNLVVAVAQIDEDRRAVSRDARRHLVHRGGGLKDGEGGTHHLAH